jgi:UDP-N-acetylmuramyl pentapeptide phosphotransferase/UDP-N-acetylglucosamine-1-phosphate transferase
MTGLYSLAVIFPLYLTEQNYAIASLELFCIIGLLVFNFYNTRKKAVCFAGDVGSISIAIIIVFLLIFKIQATQNFIFLGLLLIYGIDSCFTILHRLRNRENIFSAHRKHLYQYLSNEKKVPQLWVSGIFSLLQFGINLLLVFGYLGYIGIIIIFLGLSLIYWLIKAPFLAVPAN